MKAKLFIGVLGILSSLSILGSQGVKAQTPQYLDANSVSDWAKPYVTRLSNLNCMIGYPDGKFRPKVDITRQELAVVMGKCLELIESNSINYTDNQLQGIRQEIFVLQAELTRLSDQVEAQQTEILDLKEEAEAKRNNHLAVGLQYGLDGDLAVALEGKIRVISFGDFGLSARPGINTSKEGYLSATLDWDASDEFTLYGGAGGAIAFDDTSNAVLTNGRGGDVTPYAQAGIEYNFSKTVGAYVDTKYTLEDDAKNDIVVTTGITIKF